MAFSGTFARPFSPPFGGGGEIDWWYNPGGIFDAFIGDIYAWRASNTPGSIWDGGPANYAATLIDQNNGQVLVEGNGAVPWAMATGWGFIQANAQYLDTQLVLPAIAQIDWSIFVQYANTLTVGNIFLAGVTSNPTFGFGVNAVRFGNVGYYNGLGNYVAPTHPTGNLGTAGSQGYRDGIADGPAIAAGINWARTIWIGGANDRAVTTGDYVTAEIRAVWICTSNPAVVQANALALATAMAGL